MTETNCEGHTALVRASTGAPSSLAPEPPFLVSGCRTTVKMHPGFPKGINKGQSDMQQWWDVNSRALHQEQETGDTYLPGRQLLQEAKKQPWPQCVLFTDVLQFYQFIRKYSHN